MHARFFRFVIVCMPIVALLLPVLASAVMAAPAPSIDTVITNVNNRFAEIKDISGTVDLEQYSADGAVTKALVEVQSTLPNLLRLKFIQPDAFADTIYVLDRKANQVWQYSPIMEQVFVSSIDQVLSERYVPTTVEQLFSLPSPEDYNLAVLKTETKGSENWVWVSARAKAGDDAPLFHFAIDQQQWMVRQMQVFDAKGKILFSISLRNMKLNQGLNANALKKMPGGATVVYR